MQSHRGERRGMSWPNDRVPLVVDGIVHRDAPSSSRLSWPAAALVIILAAVLPWLGIGAAVSLLIR